MRTFWMTAMAGLLFFARPVRADEATQKALCDAVSHGTPEQISAAAQQGADLDAMCADMSETPLEIAAQQGNAQNVEQLLNSGARADQVDSRQSTALSFSRSADVTRILLARGVDVNRRDSDGSTALMELAEFADQIPEQTAIDIAQQLLDKGADVNTTDNESDSTALINAVHTKYTRFMELLIAHGANVNARNSAGNTPLDIVMNAMEMVPRIGEDPAQYQATKDLLIAHGGIQ